MSDASDVRQVQELIGAELPAGAHDLLVYRYEPGEQLAFFTVYIKFAAPEEAFTTLAEQMDMDFHNRGGAALMFLPAAWGAEPEVALSWWDAGPDTPAASAAKPFGENGWIVAKYEDGHVYMIVSDSGFYE